ncbi:MAG: ABC transporter substrate-binding protein [Thermomicrobiales bacterium]
MVTGSAALGLATSAIGPFVRGTGTRAAAPNRADATTIQFMGWGQPSEQEVFETLIASFEEANPDVKVDYLLVPPGEFLQKLTTLAAAGDLPDVFYMAADWFGAWVPKGVLRSMDEFLAEQDLSDIWPQALDRYRYDGEVIGRGQLYALPKDLGPFVHVYNQDLYDQYGVPHPPIDGSWTWDVALEGWAAMTKFGSGGSAESFGVGALPLEAAVWSNGADYLNADRTQVTVDDPKFIEALQFAANLSCEHHVAPTQSELASIGAWDMWLQGKIGSFVMGPWDQPTFWTLPFKWDVSPFPASPTTGQPANWVGSMGYAVSAESGHPELAVELARFFSASEEGQRMTYQLGQAVPNLMSMAKGEFLAYEKAPVNRQVFVDAIEKWGRPTLGWYTSNDEWIDEMGQGMDPVWSCEASAEDWANESAGKLTETLAKEEQIPTVLS